MKLQEFRVFFFTGKFVCFLLHFFSVCKMFGKHHDDDDDKLEKRFCKDWFFRLVRLICVQQIIYILIKSFLWMVSHCLLSLKRHIVGAFRLMVHWRVFSLFTRTLFRFFSICFLTLYCTPFMGHESQKYLVRASCDYFCFQREKEIRWIAKENTKLSEMLVHVKRIAALEFKRKVADQS